MDELWSGGMGGFASSEVVTRKTKGSSEEVGGFGTKASVRHASLVELISSCAHRTRHGSLAKRLVQIGYKLCVIRRENVPRNNQGHLVVAKWMTRETCGLVISPKQGYPATGPALSAAPYRANWAQIVVNTLSS
ncbi:hypothetical protein Bbelb_003850 [Branchiostoma belcheri]|nr:hypothetical protein Bbelb_003850 [Branchiostoma belcheri]